MDWTYAIERNRDALKRVLAALVAMAGLAVAGSPFSPTGSKRRAAIDAGASIAVAQGGSVLSLPKGRDGEGMVPVRLRTLTQAA